MGVYLIKECLATPSWGWKWDEVERCSTKELEALCQLIGLSTGGNNNKKIERLKAATRVRKELSGITEPEQLTTKFKRTELADLAKSVGAIHYLNKYAIAASLINWRNTCNRQAKENIKEAMAYLKKRKETKQPTQLYLDLFPVKSGV